MEFNSYIVEKYSNTSYSIRKREHQAMTTYLLMETALKMITNAYLLSIVLLIATSYIGLSVIEVIEQGDRNPLKTKWFN